MLAAQRRTTLSSTRYAISLSGIHSSASTGNVTHQLASGSRIVATVCGNRNGTQYRCFVANAAAHALRDAAPAIILPAPLVGPEGAAAGLATAEAGVELLAVQFQQATAAETAGVREFSVVAPDPTPDASAATFCEHGRARGGLLDRQKSAEGRKGPASEGLFVARSVKPAYVASRKMHVIDFAGRVHEGSPKNCMLAAQDLPGGPADRDAAFLFGKHCKNLYALDFAYPFTLLQATCIAVACFDTRTFAA